MGSRMNVEAIDLLELIGRDTELERVASTSGGEWSGPCPFCGGDDRFNVWPNHPQGKGRWWCRKCGRAGDAIDYIQERDHSDFPRAVKTLGLEIHSSAGLVQAPTRTRARPKLLVAPGAQWQRAARRFAEESERHLWGHQGRRALDWLRGRGFRDESIRRAHLGYNPVTHYETWEDWGLDARDGSKQGVWLPRGMMIPWEIDGELWRINIRRPLTPCEVQKGKPKYVGPAGYRNALYNAHELSPDRPAILAEGELDAITIAQHAGDLATPVASGSTAGARKVRWVARLALSPLVLVAFDADHGGDQAADYWMRHLDNARRWRPYWEDANRMARDGTDLRAWISKGLE